MLRMRRSERKTIKPLGTMAVFVGAIGVCLMLPCWGLASGNYYWSKPFLCVPTAVAARHPNGACRSGTAESENLLDFFKIKLKEKVVRTEGKQRQSLIKEVSRSDGELSIYGSQGVYGF